MVLGPLGRLIACSTVSLLIVDGTGSGLADPGNRDLVASFASAHLGVETRLIDFGVPGARRHLLAGFGDDEQGIVWGLGKQSILEFHLARPRDLALTLRCAPFDVPDAPPQRVTLELNGHPGSRVAIRAGVANYEVALPRAATRSGWNRLVLRYAWSRKPADLFSSRDRRPLAVAWDFILFHDVADSTRAPMADERQGSVTIPAGTSVSYYLHPRPGARLSVDAIALTAEPGTSLAVRLESDAGRETLARVTRPWRHRTEIPLAAGSDNPFRLSFAAEGGTVRLVRPGVHVPADAPGGAPREMSYPQRPNVLVYLIDTLRADRLGCYGNDRPTSPHIDALAREGIVFTNAFAESSWTRTTVASLLTGLTPPSHGVHGRFDALGDGPATMGGLLSAEGYETVAFVANGNVAPVFGFGRGFGVYDLLPGAVLPGSYVTDDSELPRSNHLTARARSWLRSRVPDRPFLLYVHAADPHGPYTAPARFRRRFGIGDEDAGVGSLKNLQRLHAKAVPVDEALTAKMRAAYEAEIAHNDHYFGRLIADLKHRGLYDDMLVVVVADHGEEFHEHGGWEHGQTLYREVVHVPLLVKLPRGEHAGLRLDTPAQLADVLPTLLARLGMPPPTGLEGTDLLERLEHAAPASPRATFAHLALDGYVADAIQKGPWKMVLGEDGGELFDRRRDAEELASVLPQHVETAGYLRAELRERRAPGEGSARTAVPIPDDVRRNLRALGYVE